MHSQHGDNARNALDPLFSLPSWRARIAGITFRPGITGVALGTSAAIGPGYSLDALLSLWPRLTLRSLDPLISLRTGLALRALDALLARISLGPLRTSLALRSCRPLRPRWPLLPTSTPTFTRITLGSLCARETARACETALTPWAVISPWPWIASRPGKPLFALWSWGTSTGGSAFALIPLVALVPLGPLLALWPGFALRTTRPSWTLRTLGSAVASRSAGSRLVPNPGLVTAQDLVRGRINAKSLRWDDPIGWIDRGQFARWNPAHQLPCGSPGSTTDRIVRMLARDLKCRAICMHCR